MHWTILGAARTLVSAAWTAQARGQDPDNDVVEETITMKLTLDRPRCEGHGLCEEAAPDLMYLDDDGELVLQVEEVDDTRLDAARAAVRVCPVAALRLE